ncbi:MAG: 30S ribosome-binding factor RbfA [Thiobacillaceae bacterium]|nr:30S ribosome-binding factor RbfA [Thiobacillaceae bacterium]MCX7673092.1 30S ribosome-binding factor RbfA [Thiobacillaceae bacterium]MDW8323608.1 30S ribosome-binding factor RbfA [Burkholderiales bacterium]
MHHRAQRIAEQIRQELALILMRGTKDPRIHDVTITAVEVSSDLEHAKVWYTLMQGDAHEVGEALEHAAGYLRSELAQRLRLRIMPRLAFKYDQSIERGARLSRLIDQVVAEDRARHADDETQG